MLKKMLFIYNPHAGKAMIQKNLNHILNYYTEKGYLVTVYPTQCAGDGYAFMRRVSEPYDLIVTSGGDGTMNEVVSGMLDAGTQYQLGYLPMGSTNDFATGIGLEHGLEQALATSVKGRMTALDIGRLNDKHFIYVAACGMFTDIPYSTPQKLKNTFGYLAYFLQGILSLTDIKPVHMKITMGEDVFEDDFFVGMVTNSLSVSGFKNPVSGVTQLNDGMLEAIFVRMPKSIFELRAIIASLLSGNPDHPKILSMQLTEIKIEAEALSWTIDGEYGGTYDESVIKALPRRMMMRIFDDGNLQEKLLLPPVKDSESCDE